MNQRIHIINHDDLNDSTDRMIADYEREQAGERDDAQSGLVVGVVFIGLLGFVAGLAIGIAI